jgi:hypothetical protein
VHQYREQKKGRTLPVLNTPPEGGEG